MELSKVQDEAFKEELRETPTKDDKILEYIDKEEPLVFANNDYKILEDIIKDEPSDFVTKADSEPAQCVDNVNVSYETFQSGAHDQVKLSSEVGYSAPSLVKSPIVVKSDFPSIVVRPDSDVHTFGEHSTDRYSSLINRSGLIEIKPESDGSDETGGVHPEEYHTQNQVTKGLDQSSERNKNLHTHTDEKQYVCPTCGEQFKRADHYKIHFRIHTSEKPFVCPSCGIGFTRAENFKTHLKKHTAERPFVCPKCSKRFITACDLRRHATIHTEEKRFVCPTCNKGFNKHCQLRVHLRSHTGEKPFVCPICSKELVSSQTLRNHLKTTHTDEKPFVCPTCGKGFHHECDLKRHVKIHTREKNVHVS